MRYVNTSAKLLSLFALMLLMGSLLAGCGGGGGGGGGISGGNGGGNQSGNIIIQGTVIDTTQNNQPLAGWTVKLDGGQTAVTGANGAFSLSVPVSAISSSNTLTLLDPSSVIQAVDTFDFQTLGPSPIQLPTPLTVGPPVPPGGV